ncbi:MAG: hypothetical protein LBP36_00685 [Oscillospiraceae bacterium]|jgi:hypothetical protein|nr:hypothetical protein [Oscillospiraceae bacterium]
MSHVSVINWVKKEEENLEILEFDEQGIRFRRIERLLGLATFPWLIESDKQPKNSKKLRQKQKVKILETD